MLKCIKCEDEFDLSEFPDCKYNNCGKRHECRSCTSIYQKEYREKNKDKAKAYQKIYRKANKSPSKSIMVNIAG